MCACLPPHGHHHHHLLFIFSPPSSSDPSASLPGDHSSIFCAILPGFQLMTPGIPCACPLFIFRHPPLPPAILKRGETRREWGEQQENSSWDSAARSVVARAERMACCVGQWWYCVSDPFSPSLLSFLMSSIPPFKPRNLFILQKV